MITAKITCTSKTVEFGGTQLVFSPDYAEGRNAEWAVATPALSLAMNVNGAVADRFAVGKNYTLQFVEDLT